MSPPFPTPPDPSVPASPASPSSPAVALTVPARLERALTVAILRGEYPPGGMLPTVREMAREFQVNAATVQRVVARLEMTGLVSVRRGSGIRVNDPDLCSDLSLLPAWVDALREEPARAANIVADFLELRRMIAGRLIVKHRAKLAGGASRLLDVASDFESALERDGSDISGIMEADLAVARALIGLTGQSAARAVFNTLEKLMRAVPLLGEAMYADARRNVRDMRKVVSAIATATDEAQLATLIEDVLEETDRRTVRRFRAALERVREGNLDS